LFGTNEALGTLQASAEKCATIFELILAANKEDFQ